MSKGLIGKIVLAIVLIAAVSLGILFIVSRSKTASVDNSIFNIILERGPCFGTCPIYYLAIDNTGNVSLRQQNQADQTYRIPAANALSLFNQALRINFFNLNDRYENLQVTDLPSTKISIQTPSTTKSVYMYGLEDTVPQTLTDLAKRIDEVAEVNKHLQPTYLGN
jgi:hypothetical protein